MRVQEEANDKESGHPSKYQPRKTTLNFGDRTRTGISDVIRPRARHLVVDKHNSRKAHKNSSHVALMVLFLAYPET